MVNYNLSFSHLLKYNRNHDNNGRFSSGAGGGGSTISATGANKFKTGFSTKNLNIHWSRHGKEYPGVTKKQYANRALAIIQKPVGGDILGYKTKQGRIVRYNTRTMDFVSGHPNVGIATMINFKSNGGMKRFLYLKKRDEDK